MTSSADTNGQSEQRVAERNPDDHLSGRLRRDPFVVLLEAAGRAPTLLDAVHARLSGLPGWMQLSAGMATSILSIYFGRLIRMTIDELVATLAGPVVGGFEGTSLGTLVVILLLSGVAAQLAAVNSRLERVVRIVGRKSNSSVGKIVNIMDGNAATDGGHGHAADDPEPVTGSWRGILAGIAAGATLGSVFGVDGVTGGAVFGAFFGNWVEQYVIRNRRGG